MRIMAPIRWSEIRVRPKQAIECYVRRGLAVHAISPMDIALQSY